MDQTIDWYRTLGIQQQNAGQPSDLLILYANRQIAGNVVELVFEMARANAELLSSEAGAVKNGTGQTSTPSLDQRHSVLDAERQTIEREITADRQKRSSTGKGKQELEAKLAELQSELAMNAARANLLDTMAEFVYQRNPETADAESLKAHIDAIAASIPILTSSVPQAAGAAPTTSVVVPGASDAAEKPPARYGIWDLAQNALRLKSKISAIEAVAARTKDLAAVFRRFSQAPLAQLKAYSSRSDALASQADSASGSELQGLRAQFDTLAWLFKQTSSILLPLSKEGVLLQQYDHNLNNWRDTTRRQYHEALISLGVRLGVLLAMLAVVFILAQLWRRAVLRYVHEARRRYQLLLVRNILMWCLIVIILGLSFVTQISTFATFAGLLTAGVAVAMQSVLVSVVGYFFLIGKYGIRVGDRVQIGSVVGEVLDLGLVRMHLMEFNEQAALGPTGRVVAYPNLIVFQASGGLFKQIPGVDLAWHEMTLTLPNVSNYAALKTELAAAVESVIADYRAEIERQKRTIQGMSVTEGSTGAIQRVQMHILDGQMKAQIGYPVHLEHAAEIDERVSEAVLQVINAHSTDAQKR